MIIKKIINLMMPGTEFEVPANSADAMLLLAVVAVSNDCRYNHS